MEISINKDKMSESEKKFRQVMIKTGLNKELNWKDNRQLKKIGIYELEHGTKIQNELLKKFCFLVTFGMTLAVFYSKKTSNE
jgi:hypothetical protein